MIPNSTYLTAGCALVVIILLTTCNRPEGTPLVGKPDYESLPAIEDGAMNVVVEIPAGTNQKIEYSHTTHEFLPDTLMGGAERVVRFLPYPGNYGFVPGTLMDAERGGDGDPLDVLVISESVATGSILRVRPIGALLLRDRGEVDTKIIAVPADSLQRTLPVDNFIDFMLLQDPARRIIESWFLNYKGPESIQLVRWEDDQYAWAEVRRWQR
jgi:inorganic pyrophosphatase